MQATTGESSQPAFLQPVRGKPWSELPLTVGVNCSSLPLPVLPILNGANWERMSRGGLEAGSIHQCISFSGQ